MTRQSQLLIAGEVFGLGKLVLFALSQALVALAAQEEAVQPKTFQRCAELLAKQLESRKQGPTITPSNALFDGRPIIVIMFRPSYWQLGKPSFAEFFVSNALALGLRAGSQFWAWVESHASLSCSHQERKT